tara:strand:- start:457 stop:1284 length:828 start_codon:yes stop_codon:yes gene_type:complete
MEDLFDIIGLDFGSGKRNVDLKKQNKKLSEEFPDPSKITAKDIEDKYGFDNLPANLQTILGPTGEKIKFDVPKGMKRLPDGRVVPKDAVNNPLLRAAGGFIDEYIMGGSTDLDKMGSGLETYDVIKSDDLSKRVLSPYQQKQVQSVLTEDFGKEKTATEGIKENIEALKEVYPELSEMARKERRKAAIDTTLQYAATEPLRQAFLNRAAEQATQRGLRVRGALEAMPSNIQNIMTAKQQQQSLASLTEAERQRATATQQDAATRFAGLGMQRRFG